MSNFKISPNLHKQAESYHEAAAFLHRMAAQHHHYKNLMDAKKYSKNAMECSMVAQQNSTKADLSSSKS